MVIMVHGLSKELCEKAAQFGAIASDDTANFRHHILKSSDDCVKLRHINDKTAGEMVIRRDEFIDIELL